MQLATSALKITAYALQNGQNRTWAIPQYMTILDKYQQLIVDACASGLTTGVWWV